FRSWATGADRRDRRRAAAGVCGAYAVYAVDAAEPVGVGAAGVDAARGDAHGIPRAGAQPAACGGRDRRTARRVAPPPGAADRPARPADRSARARGTGPGGARAGVTRGLGAAALDQG